MATYRGSPFEAGIGPADGDIVLFAACPPPEDLGFEPATGHWRKQLRLSEVQAVWESRPVGTFRGERCIVLDDLGDRLHIGYLGHDGYRAEQLGYWQVDRGVFELVAARDEVTEIVEERTDYLGQTGPGPAFPAGRPAGAGYGAPTGEFPVAGEPGRTAAGDGGVALPPPPTSGQPLPLEAEAMRAASAASRRDQPDPLTGPSPLSHSGPHTSPSPLSSSGPLGSSGPLSSPAPLNGPGPLNSSGPHTSPGPLNGPGPLNRPSPLSSPAPLNGPGPLAGSSSLSSSSSLGGPASLDEPGRAADRTASRLTPSTVPCSRP